MICAGTGGNPMQDRSSALLAVGIAFLLAVACDRTSPTSPAPSPPQAPMPMEVKLLGARHSVAVGEAFQLQASAWLRDGSVIDVTKAATWRSYTPAASISNTGFIHFLQEGDAKVSAQYQNIEDAWLVRVQSPSGGH